jgi:glycosyltransferase involved in cell wall biosynthesis
VVFLFVGRLKRDKGVLDLAGAFERLALPSSILLFVGPDEENLQAEIMRLCAATAERIRFVGWSDRPERYMAAADVFCLPSYREGFGTAVLEAAAVGLPAIGSRIYGIVDAIEEGRTGLLFEPGNVTELAAAMRTMADDARARETLGAAAGTRALSDFSKDAVTRGYSAFYQRVLDAGAPPVQPERLRSRFD